MLLFMKSFKRKFQLFKCILRIGFFTNIYNIIKKFYLKKLEEPP